MTELSYRSGSLPHLLRRSRSASSWTAQHIGATVGPSTANRSHGRAVAMEEACARLSTLHLLAAFLDKLSQASSSSASWLPDCACNTHQLSRCDASSAMH